MRGTHRVGVELLIIMHLSKLLDIVIDRVILHYRDFLQGKGLEGTAGISCRLGVRGDCRGVLMCKWLEGTAGISCRARG